MAKAKEKEKKKKDQQKIEKVKSKKYTTALGKVERNKKYLLEDACNLVKELSTSKFDGSIECHIRLNFDTTKDSVRSTLTMPHGTGKKLKIIVFADDKLADEAKQAGAIEAGSKNLIEKIQKGWLDFDLAIAHPSIMPEVGKLGKILGTKGLMPNPKAGTITPDVVAALKEFSAGKTEFKADSFGIIHMSVGKISFDASQIKANIEGLVAAVKKAKPPKAKGQYIVSIFLSPTMGPSVPLDVNQF
ncbi:50S ribosomal protein L1 [Patescibacteria group bacterium]|nr:50S ribosomal protein L1 [Patescibacteria group bacterium]